MKNVRIPSPRGDLFGLLEIPSGFRATLPGVVFLHGFTSNHDESPIVGVDDSIFKRAERQLTTAGFATLRFDFSGHGESRALPFEEIELPGLIDDALTAVSYLAQQPEVSNDLLLLGQSMGGLVAACAAHRDERIRAAALWNAPSNPFYTIWSTMGPEAIATALVSGVVEFPWDEKGLFRLKRRYFESLIETSILEEMSKFDGRLLVVAGQNDDLVRPQPQTAEAFLRVHHGTQRLVMLNSDHTFNVTQGLTKELDAAIQETINWFCSSVDG